MNCFLFAQIPFTFSETGVTPKFVKAVDLGLPSGIKWANYNLGADRSYVYGFYFAWGETYSFKSAYNSKTYKWCEGENHFTKYCGQAEYGLNDYTDTLTCLLPEDDAASVCWGGNWRIPTKDEYLELMKYCSWKWTEKKGRRGFIVTGPNGKSIFFPAAGSSVERKLCSVNKFGHYWTSSLNTKNSQLVYILQFNFPEPITAESYMESSFRYEGLSIRPVYDCVKSN